jgi:predicted DNA-binding protein
MTTKSPRIQVSLPPDVYQTIENLSQLRGIPKSRVLSEIIVEMAPGLSRVALILNEAKNASSEVLGGMREAVHMLGEVIDPFEDELYRLADSERFKKALNPHICNTGVHSPKSGG